MKRSLLKMLTLALAMVLAFSFMAGCGGDDGNRGQQLRRSSQPEQRLQQHRYCDR